MTITRTSFNTGDIPSTSEWNTQFDTAYNQVNAWISGTDAISVTQLDSDNLRIDGNSITSTNTDGSINITPNGSGNVILKTTTGITASTTQSQGQGALTSIKNIIETVTNEDDVVTLPSASSGAEVIVHNKGANILQIFPNTGEDLSKGANTSLKIATNTIVVFLGESSTEWVIKSKKSTAKNEIMVTTGAGHGSTNTKIRRIETERYSSGNAISVSHSSTDGTSFTIKEQGVYSIAYQDSTTTSGGTHMGISLNSNQLTTNIISIDDEDIISKVYAPDANFQGFCGITRFFNEGDVIRPHDTGALNVVDAYQTRFSICKTE